MKSLIVSHKEVQVSMFKAFSANLPEVRGHKISAGYDAKNLYWHILPFSNDDHKYCWYVDRDKLDSVYLDDYTSKLAAEWKKAVDYFVNLD